MVTTRRFAIIVSIAATLVLGCAVASTDAQPAKKKTAPAPVVAPQVKVVVPNQPVVVAVQDKEQNGQAGDQGEKQNGQAGDQGEKQNGQAGDQGEKQNGQVGDQGGKGNGQVKGIAPNNGVVIAQAKNGRGPIQLAAKNLPALAKNK